MNCITVNLLFMCACPNCAISKWFLISQCQICWLQSLLWCILAGLRALYKRSDAEWTTWRDNGEIAWRTFRSSQSATWKQGSFPHAYCFGWWVEWSNANVQWECIVVLCWHLFCILGSFLYDNQIDIIRSLAVLLIANFYFCFFF